VWQKCRSLHQSKYCCIVPLLNDSCSLFRMPPIRSQSGWRFRGGPQFFRASTGKVKVNLSLCSVKHHTMIYCVSGGIAPRIPHLGTRLRWVVIFTPLPLHSRERIPAALWVGGWADPRAGLDAVARRKNPSPSRESNPDFPARSLVTILTELPLLSHCETRVYYDVYRPNAQLLSSEWLRGLGLTERCGTLELCVCVCVWIPVHILLSRFDISHLLISFF
jgi:hypothetical protein